jgi:hypothetical protein
MYVLDFGGRNKAVYMTEDGKTTETITWEEVLNLPSELNAGDKIIVEKAHMMCPKEQSLAQPFNANELLQFYQDCKTNMIDLRFFPEKQTPVAVAHYGKMHPGDAEKIKKMDSDELSALAIYGYINDPRTNLTLGKPPRGFTPKKEVLRRQVLGCPEGIKEEGWYFKKRLNETLNFARKDGYDLDGDRGDVNTQWILANINAIRAELIKKFDEVTVDTIFNFKCYTKKYKGHAAGELSPSKLKNNMGLLYTVLATLRDIDGELMLRQSTGRFMSVNHIHRYVMCMSPNHHKGGIARSNIMWHGFRNHLRGSLTWDTDKKQPIDPKINFRRKILVSGGSNKNQGKLGEYVVNRGLFTDEEDKLFIAERKKYVAVLKELNRIYRRLLKPEWYDENGYLIPMVRTGS